MSRFDVFLAVPASQDFLPGNRENELSSAPWPGAAPRAPISPDTPIESRRHQP